MQKHTQTYIKTQNDMIKITNRITNSGWKVCFLTDTMIEHNHEQREEGNMAITADGDIIETRKRIEKTDMMSETVIQISMQKIDKVIYNRSKRSILLAFIFMSINFWFRCSHRYNSVETICFMF